MSTEAVSSTGSLYRNCLQGLAPVALEKRVLACIPNNWLDPLLTGPRSMKIPAGCPDVEWLLNRIRNSIWLVFRGIRP